MNTPPAKPDEPADLRKRAEAQASAAKPPAKLTPAQARQLKHELQVHQIELELQNEELRRVQAALERLQTRYFDLFDLAPVGYVTLNEQGLILEANLTAANLLGVTRTQLVQRPLGSLVCKEDQDDYYRYRQQLDSPLVPTAASAALLCELRMKRAGGTLWVRLDAAKAQDDSGAPLIRVTLSDITERKQLEDVQAFLSQREGAVVGASFFEALASYLARTLAMDFVCIDRLEGDGLTAQTVAVWCDGKFEDNTAYALKDTPCGDVVGQTVCCFPASVCQHFPRDTVLKDLRAESYLGVTLWGHAGQPIGLIAVISRKPLANRPLAEAILKTVAVRAGAEMERLAVETTLRASEEKYRGIFDESVATIYTFDTQKHFIGSNQAGLELLGYTREELLHLSLADVDANPVEVLLAHRHLLAGGRLTNFEHQLRRKDGRVITVLNNSRPLTDARGQVVGLLSTLLDITDRKQAEEALHRNEAQLRITLNTTIDGILAVDRQGKIIQVNHRFAELWQIPPALLESHDDQRLLAFVLDQLVEPEAFLLKVQALYVSDEEEEDLLTFKDGRIFERYSSPMLEAGVVTGRVWSFRDITERQRAAVALQASEQKFRLLVEHIQDVFWISTPSLDRILYVSPSYEQCWGRTCASLYARPASFVEAIHPADQERVGAAFAGHARGEWHVEYRILRPDGEVRWMLDRGSPVRDENGAMLYMCGVVTDVTARKQTDELLRQSETRLRAITDSAQDAIVMMDPDDRISFWNPAATQIFGYTSAEALGQPLHAFLVPPRYHAAHQSAFPAFRQTGQGANVGRTLDLEAWRKDGREISVQLSLSAVELEGRWHAVGLIRDITARKQAEAALQAAETLARKKTALLKSIMESPRGMIIFALDRSYCYTEFTTTHKKVMYQLWGVEITVGMNMLDCISDPADRAKARDHFDRALQGEAQVQEEAYGDSALTRNYYENRYGPIFDGSGAVTGLTVFVIDISERRRAQAALQASEARYRLVSENGGDVIWLFDLATNRFAFLSPSVEKLFGYTLAESQGRSMLDTLTPEDRQLVAERLPQRLAAFAGGDNTVRSQCHELEQIRKDGSRVWTEVVTTLIADERRQVTHLQGITRDISGRKQAEAALQARELKYRRIFENIQDVFYEVRLDGTIEEVSPSIAAISRGQYAREDLLGKSMYGFYADPQTRDDLLRILREKGSLSDHTVWLKNRDGSLIPCSLSAKLLTDATGQPDRITGTLRDITERKQAEDLLLLQGAALAAAANAIVITDAQGVVEWANPAFSTLTGYGLEEACGRNTRDLLKSGQQAAAFYAELWDTISAGHVWHGELVNRRKDGTLYTEDMTITPLHGARGEIQRFIAIKQDITGRKALESQLLRSQRMESIGRLAGGIAHDLNNILAPVLLAPPLLRAAIHDPDTRELVDLVEASTQRGAEIIRQLLTFSRGLKGERIPLHLALLVREMYAIMRETFPKNITLHLDLPAGIPPVTGDTTQLHQVLMNLCVNARDALPDGGELTLSLEAVTLDPADAATIPDGRPGRFVVLGVGDTGTGIEPKILDRIFDPFFTTKPVGKGSGLGLSTSLGIVRSHAGFIQVRSAPGQGTLFRIFLPISVTLTAPADNVLLAAPQLPQGHGEQVLVVDDEAHLRHMARKILEGNGYRVLEAQDGAEALRLLESSREPPQVVLTDLLMPHMDGPTLIRQLRQLPAPPRIVAMGGLPPPPEDLRELGLTAGRFLHKPFDTPALLNALHALLAEK